jgi:excisionase family DNA binding protein
MAILSISEAARAWGIGRSTLQRAIKEGRLSAANRADGSKGIDTAELLRVFGEACSDACSDTGVGRDNSKRDTGSSRSEAGASLQADTAPVIDALQAQIALLQTALTEAKEREEWLRGQVESLQLRLLPPPKKPFLEKLAEAWGRLRKQGG